MTQSQSIETEAPEMQSKAVPFAVKRGWVGIPNAIYTVYSKHPDVNLRAIQVYGFLLMNHNDKFGYAYPSQVQIAVALGVSRDTIVKAVASLLKVGLIDVEFSSKYNGNQYTFPTICETIEELVAKFPEIKPHLAKLEAKAVEVIATGQKDKARQRGANKGNKSG